MRGLPVLIFAAGMAIWGVASIPDGSGAGRTSPANRLGEAAWTTHRAFAAPTGKVPISGLHAAPLESRGASAGGRESVRVSFGRRS
jgi:hypothetical protein